MKNDALGCSRTNERRSARPTGRALFERQGMATAVLDTREAAAYLAVEPPTVYRLARSGELPHVRVGRSLRFRVEDLNRYLEERTSRNWTPHGKERLSPQSRLMGHKRRRPSSL